MPESKPIYGAKNNSARRVITTVDTDSFSSDERGVAYEVSEYLNEFFNNLTGKSDTWYWFSPLSDPSTFLPYPQEYLCFSE